LHILVNVDFSLSLDEPMKERERKRNRNWGWRKPIAYIMMKEAMQLIEILFFLYG
jgi:hypothetical protein